MVKRLRTAHSKDRIRSCPEAETYPQLDPGRPYGPSGRRIRNFLFFVSDYRIASADSRLSACRALYLWKGPMASKLTAGDLQIITRIAVFRGLKPATVEHIVAPA